MRTPGVPNRCASARSRDAPCDGNEGQLLTGGGFGGCTVSIVEAPCVEAFVRDVGAGYAKATGLCADFYEADAEDGAGRMERP